MCTFQDVKSTQETAGSVLNRLYNVKYTFGSSTPSYIFHNQHKTLNNLYISMLVYAVPVDAYNIQANEDTKVTKAKKQKKKMSKAFATLFQSHT